MATHKYTTHEYKDFATPVDGVAEGIALGGVDL